MEFGGFADDLFEEAAQKKKTIPSVEYKPKVLTPQWYSNEDSAPTDDLEKVQFYVYQGDHHYYRGEWVSAADAYARALGYVAPNNPCMRRLLLESLARCKLRCGEFDAAVQFGESLLNESTSENQLFTAHSALATLYAAAGMIKEETKSLRYCLDVRPMGTQHWIQLAKALMKTRSMTPVKPSCNASDSDTENGLILTRESPNENDDHAGKRKETEHSKESLCFRSLSKTSHLEDREPDLQGDAPAQTHIQEVQVPDTLSCGRGESAQCNNHECATRVECSTGKPDCSTNSDGVVNAEVKDSLPAITSGVVTDLRMLSVKENTRTVLRDDSTDDICGSGDASIPESSENGDLVREVATCLIKAKLLLGVEALSAVSIAKKRNEQLLCEVEELLQSLHLHPTILDEITDQTQSLSG